MDSFSRKDAQSQSNLLLKIDKGWLAGGHIFCFLS